MQQLVSTADCRCKFIRCSQHGNYWSCMQKKCTFVGPFNTGHIVSLVLSTMSVMGIARSISKISRLILCNLAKVKFYTALHYPWSLKSEQKLIPQVCRHAACSFIGSRYQGRRLPISGCILAPKAGLGCHIGHWFVAALA
jgi:hypothetical protein